MTRHFFNLTEKFRWINLTERVPSESIEAGQLSTAREKLAPLNPCTESGSMSNRDIQSTFTNDLKMQIDDLAKTALSDVRQRLQPNEQKKITETSKWLTQYCVSGSFDLDSALDVLDQKLIPSEVIIDYCIPLAAEELGNDWVDDLKGFGQVTLATSRLQMILNNLINYQNSEAEIASRFGLMLIICKDEQHTLGPSILADQLRRRGQSVKLLHSADSDELVNLCKSHDFSAVLFSCAGHHSIDYINKSITSLDNLVQRPLIFVGGKILDLEPAIKDKVAADAFTNDIELVISKVRKYISNRISPEAKKWT
tara:strand:+ start:134 stop:1066 length:933 start_codon:yes stop_codon:yes gene_type:complete